MNNLVRLLVLFCIFTALTCGMQPATQSETSVQKLTYLVIYRPGPAWIANKPIKEQPLKEHFQYMLSLYKKGASEVCRAICG